MAFMTPIMKSGWNLYNVHPPVKVVQHSKSDARRKRTKSDPNPLPVRCATLPNRRRPSLDGATGNSPARAPQSKTDRRGRPLSHDSLKLRDLDAVMSVIPEVDDESDDNATDHPLSDPDTCSSSGSSISAGSNPALTHTTAHVRDTTGRRLLRRLRKFIRRFAVAPTKDASISPHQHIACSSTAVSSHPAGNARFHRQRS